MSPPDTVSVRTGSPFPGGYDAHLSIQITPPIHLLSRTEVTEIMG